MSAKHFIDDPTYLVNSALRSIPLLNPSVAYDAENKIIYRRAPQYSDSHPQRQVSIVSGGGSGHEPSFSAFVGPGLLSASVAGTIFASPGAEQVRKAIMSRVRNDVGVLVVVMNYTGDVLNFGLAVEKAKASGLKIEMVVVGDDVGVGRKQGGKVGRRGIAGTVLVHKIAGALAETGASLKDVHQVALQVANNLVSIGASLDHVHVPGRAKPDSPRSDTNAGPRADEIEIGMGIHNEAGSDRVRTDLPGLVKTLLGRLLDETDEDRGFLRISAAEDSMVLLVNNLGGVSVLEMGGIIAEVVGQLKRRYGIRPVRILSGAYMTSLNALGFSITLLKLTATDLGLGREMLELLEAKTSATGWSGVIDSKVWTEKWDDSYAQEAQESENLKHDSTLRMDGKLAKKALTIALERLIAAEPEITRYDTLVGDGDCGIGLKRGAEAVLRLILQDDPLDDVVMTVAKIAQVVETTMDGTSGALYAIFLNALTHSIKTLEPPSATSITTTLWAESLTASLNSLAKYTPAKPGDRTLMDALYPFVESMRTHGDVKRAAAAAHKGADSTKGMRAALGRSVYVGEQAWESVPDPGAIGLSVLLTGLAESL